MKKCLLILAVLFCVSSIHANDLEKVEKLSAKASFTDTTGYFILSDGSFWKVVSFSKRWRTIGEWWNDTQIVPKSFDCSPSDWHLSSRIEVYARNGMDIVNEADAINQDVLRQTTHMFVNKGTGQVLFAISLEPSDCIGQIFKGAYDEGYTKGHAAGYNLGYSAGQSVGAAQAKAQTQQTNTVRN